MASCAELLAAIKQAESERDALQQKFGRQLGELKQLVGNPPDLSRLSSSQRKKYDELQEFLGGAQQAITDAETAYNKAKKAYEDNLTSCALPPPCPNEASVRPIIKIKVEPQDRDTTDLEAEKKKILEEIDVLKTEKTTLEACLNNNPNISVNSDPDDDIPDGTPSIPAGIFVGLNWADALSSLQDARKRRTNGCYTDDELREIENILTNIKCFDGQNVRNYKLKKKFAISLSGTVNSSLARIFNRIKRIEFLIEQKQLRIREIDYDIADYRDRTSPDNVAITKKLIADCDALVAKCSNKATFTYATTVIAKAGPGAFPPTGGVTNNTPSSDTSMVARNGNTFILKATLSGITKVLGKNGGDCNDEDAYWLPSATVTTTITISPESYQAIIKCIGTLTGRPAPVIESSASTPIVLTDCITAS